MSSESPRPSLNLRLTLPLPPGVNNQYVTVGRRRVLSKPAQAFNKDVAKIVERARTDGVIVPAMEAALKDALIGVYLTFYFETPNRRDLDGGLKIALDALCRALGIDDRAVVDLHLTKRIDPLHPHLDIELETISDWSFDRSYVYLGSNPNDEMD
ncbi:MAG: RusA family crossover junction endodeoxyribonuclease [Thermomicrobiales bacterium]